MNTLSKFVVQGDPATWLTREVECGECSGLVEARNARFGVTNDAREHFYCSLACERLAGASGPKHMEEAT